MSQDSKQQPYFVANIFSTPIFTDFGLVSFSTPLSPLFHHAAEKPGEQDFRASERNTFKIENKERKCDHP